jgi:hypothetical protein
MTKNKHIILFFAITVFFVVGMGYLLGTLNILERIPSPMPSPYYRIVTVHQENRTYRCGETIMFTYVKEYYSSKPLDDVEKYYETQLSIDCVDEVSFENINPTIICDNEDCSKTSVLDLGVRKYIKCTLPNYPLWDFFPNVEKQDRKLLVSISIAPDNPLQTFVSQRQNINIVNPGENYACDFNG